MAKLVTGKFSFFVATLLMNQTLAYQENDPLNMSLSELLNVQVTSATKVATALKDAPATMIVISYSDIKNRGYKNLDDVMRDLPAVDLVDVHGTFPLVWAPRGAYGDENKRTLVLIDGIVENNILEGNVLSGPQYSLHNVKRIEVLWGPASALYGANAFSGVINIITKKGADINGTELEYLTGSYDSQAFKFLSGAKFNDFEFSLSGSVLSTDGPVFKERNPNYNSSYVDEAYSLVLRASYNNNRFGFHRFDRPMGYGQFANSANELFGLPLFGYNNSEGQAVDDSLAPTTINGQKGTLWHSVTSSSFVELNQQLSDYQLKQTFYYRETGIEDDSYAYTLLDNEWAFIPFTHESYLWGADLQMDHISDNGNHVIVGLDFENADVEKGYRETFVQQVSPVIRQIGDNRISDTYINKSLYAQYQFSFSEEKSTLYTLGARYDDNNIYGSSFNPRLSVVNKLSEKLTIKTLFSTAFRAPNSFDLFAKTTVRIANPDLKPETTKNFEINLSHQLSPYSFVEYIAFYKQLDDTIVSNVPIGDIDNDGSIDTQNQNTGGANIYGVELRSQFRFSNNSSVFFNLSGQESEINSVENTFQSGFNQEVPNIAKWKANFGVSWYINDRQNTYFAGRYVGSRSTTFSNPRNSIKSYFVADLVWNFEYSKAAELSLRINNLFDATYFDPAVRSANGLNFPTQYEYPGTNLALSITLKFSR
ncbi:MAG: TonB-dependent receptor [Gammaproteobacteria bacterium]|nr:TonB-dependent receptor [Gammaproteobacteria bacterium]